MRPHPPSSIFHLLPLAFLWFRLVDHLRIEWSLNPQYAYGWAVPFLCAYLVWRRIRRPGLSHASPLWRSMFASAAPHLPSPVSYLLTAVLALLYAPTRLIQEANPEWRLVSWALALITVGITLLAAYAAGDGRKQIGDSALRTPGSQLPASIFHLRNLAFPVCFFLVAVPWPTFVEGPLIQALTRANVGTTIELLGWFGVPAVQHGHVIEISTGVVGIDEACSGIRSFQATVMISLFLGELYALSVWRRALCVLLGFALAFLFNIGRTALLVWVASTQGADAIGRWHDPAGITILVGCFLALWLVSLRLRDRRAGVSPDASADWPSAIENRKPQTDSATAQSETADRKSQINSPHPPCSIFSLLSASGALLAWLLLVEVGVEAWYRARERKLPRAPVWTVDWPKESSGFQELPLSDAARRMLRPDEAFNATWLEGGVRWQGIFLRWKPGRIAVHLAKSHTPDVCLPASGRKLTAASELKWFTVRGLSLPFRGYTVNDAGVPLHVFHCLWEERSPEQGFARTSLSYGNRLEPVLAGRRNTGQRELQLAVWGIADPQAAEAAVRRQLDKLIVTERTGSGERGVRSQ